jgi:hypothetical protein
MQEEVTSIDRFQSSRTGRNLIQDYISQTQLTTTLSDGDRSRNTPRSRSAEFSKRPFGSWTVRDFTVVHIEQVCHQHARPDLIKKVKC